MVLLSDFDVSEERQFLLCAFSFAILLSLDSTYQLGLLAFMSLRI